MFMMRTKQPAGVVSNQLYLTMDDLANEVWGFAGFCRVCMPVEQHQQASRGMHVALGLDDGEERRSRAYVSALAGHALNNCRTLQWVESFQTVTGSVDECAHAACMPCNALIMLLELCMVVQALNPSVCACAVWQRHAAADHPADVPAARRAEAGPEVRVL